MSTTVSHQPEMVDELAIDSFAGGGGTSEGIVAALGRDPDIAINHDKFALAMHRINHPGTQHLVEDVVSIDAVGMCAGRPVGMLWMSPDCKDHSKAKGGKPRDKNIRGLAWACLGWVKALPKWQRPRVVFLENVEEFREWGPLLSNGKRCPVQKGAIFKQFIEGWHSLGYDQIEWRERRAWRAGGKLQAATIRKRLYVIMRRDVESIVWPEATCGNPNDAADAEKIAAGILKPWKTAADCIDWSLPRPSIFDTSAEIKAKYGVRAIRPLKPSTMARLAAGTSRYVVNNVRPFIVPVTHQGDLRTNSADEPLRTITSAHRGEHAVVTPFVTKFNSGSVGHLAEEPLHTITAHASDTHGGGAAPLGVVAPVLVRTAAVHLSTMRNAQKPFNEADKPAHTLTAGGANVAVVAGFLAQHTAGSHPGAPAHGADKPVSTITERGSQQGVVQVELAAAHMLTLRGSDRRDAPADEPTRTFSAGGNHHAVVRLPMMTVYYGTDDHGAPADQPSRTETAKPRFGLVEASAIAPPFGPEHEARAREVAEFMRAHGRWDGGEFITVTIDGVTYVIVDIGMRMLTPRERFTAQGFRSDYIIDRGILEDGTVIKFTAEQQGYMCGNSVCPPEAEDLIRENYKPRQVVRPKPRSLREFPLLEAAE